MCLSIQLGFNHIVIIVYDLSEFYCPGLIRKNLSTTVPVVTTYSKTQHTVVKERREEEEVNLELNSFVHSPNAYCLLVIILFVININESIHSWICPVCWSSPVPSRLPGITCNASGLWPVDYLGLSGALGKPCTIVMYS